MSIGIRVVLYMLTIDLALKYLVLYLNIRAMGLECLFRPGDDVNVNMVREFYAN